MILLSVYTLDQSDVWDAIVRTFDNYDTYWLSGYVKAFQIHGDGEPLLFYYTNENIKAINVVMKRDIACDIHFVGKLPIGEYWDFSSPYGYGGWLIEGVEDHNLLFVEYNSWCQSNGIVSEFVRFHPVVKNHIFAVNDYDVIGLGNTITLDLSSPDTIWANITSKNRNVIRKAQKNGVAVYNGRYPEIFREFKSIYNSTMDKDNADEYYYFKDEFYDSILDDLPENSQIFYAVFENKIIAASIILFANGRMNYHLSGSIREYGNLAPTNLILYKAALWGSYNGYKTFYLGGGVGSGEDSLFKFKKSFYRSDDLNQFFVGKKVFLQDKYSELVTMRENSISSFFPEYRA